MVLVAGIGGIFTLGTGLWSISVFVIPMENDLGWSRTTIFGALTVRALVAGALAPLVGPLFDTNNGPRLLSIASALLIGISLVGIRWIHEPWQFYFFFSVIGAMANVGGGTVLVEALVPKWFIRRRGRAIALASMGGVVGPIFPLGVQQVISAFGWRDAWMILGIFSTVILLPLALLIRTKPEDIGLLPDGELAQEQIPKSDLATAYSSSHSLEETSLTRREVLRTRSFWLLALAFSVTSLGVQGFIPNWLPYFQDIGFTAATGAAALTVFGLFVLPARLFWGFIAEQYSVRYLLMVQHFLTAAGVVLLLFIGNLGLLLLFAIFMGLAYGGYVPLQRLIYPIYYGRAHLGAIRGAMRPFITFASAVGPLVIASIYDAKGSYFLAFLVVMCTWLLAGLLFMLARPPRVSN